MIDYYKTCAVAKPVDKKKKKLMNGYKDKPNRICVECGTGYAERHEIFGGANRQHSIEDKLQIDLCKECHDRWHRGTDAETIEWRDVYKRQDQESVQREFLRMFLVLQRRRSA